MNKVSFQNCFLHAISLMFPRTACIISPMYDQCLTIVLYFGHGKLSELQDPIH